MKTIHLGRSVLAAGFGLFLLAGTAVRADTLTNSISTGWMALSPFSPNPISLQLDQFDSSLGDLQSVKILLDAAERATVAFENGSPNPANAANMSLTGVVRATAPGSVNVLTAPSIAGDDVELAANGQESGLPTYNETGADYHSYGLLTGSDQNSALLTTGLAPYIGVGTFQTDVYGQGGWSFTGTSDANMQIAGFQGVGTVRVVYDYVAVPEPGTIALAGIGILGFYCRRRFRTKASR
jgi:hypothetical protein